MPPGHRTHELTALFLLIVGFYKIPEEMTTLTLFPGVKQTAAGIAMDCTQCLGTWMMSEIWKADGKAELPC